MNLLRSMVAVIVSLFFLTGCNLFGPSQQDVIEALDATMRAFADSVDEQTPEVENAYSNAIDLVFTSDDESLIHQMNVLVNDDEISVYGDCEISEFEDYDSEYMISGNLAYELLFPRSRFPNSGYGIMEGKVTLTGGKVETIEFSLTMDEGGVVNEFLVSANGKQIDLSEQESIYNLFRQISGHLPG